MELNIDFLRQNAQYIHFFGLGFIQIKIHDYLRYHFYKPDILNPIVADTELHNHRYDFTSRVLKGHITNTAYDVFTDPEGVCSREIVTCSAKYKVEPISIRSNTFIKDTQEIYAGGVYHMNHNEFHRVCTNEPTITAIVRGTVIKPYAEVVRYIGSREICPFSCSMPEKELWEIVESMLL